MQIAVFGCAAEFFASGSPIHGPAAWGERFEDWIHAIHGLFVSADHHAVSTFEAPNAATGADVEVMNTGLFEMGATAPIVAEIGVAPIDDCVSALEVRRELVDNLVGDGGGHHDPCVPWCCQLRCKIFERARAGGAFASELLYRFGIGVIDDALVTLLNQAPDHVGAHPAETDHSELHRGIFGILILGAAYPWGNKIQRKDLSAATDPGDAVRFAEGLGLPSLPNFRPAKSRGAGGKKTGDPPKRGESLWWRAQELESRRGRRAPALLVDRNDAQKPNLSGREILEPSDGHAVLFGKLYIAKVPPNQLWRFSHFELVLLDHPGHGIWRRLVPSDLKNSVAGLEHLDFGHRRNRAH